MKLKPLVLSVAVALFVYSGYASAQATRVIQFPASSKMTQAVEGTLENNLYRRGYGNAANASVFADARSAATANAIGTTVGAVAAGVGVVALGLSPFGWAGVAVQLVIGVAVPYAINSTYAWYFKPDGSVATVAIKNFGYASATGPAPTYFYASGPDYEINASSILGAYYGVVGHYQGTPEEFPSYHSVTPTTAMTVQGSADLGGSWHSVPIYVQPRFDSPPPDTSTANPADGVKPGTLAEAVSKLPKSDLAKPLNPALVARSLNDAWRLASAEPGYSGIPYDALNPVTESDVTGYKTAHPDDYPTVQDWLSPQTAGLPYVSPGNAGTSSSASSPSAPLAVAPTPAPGSIPSPSPSTGTNTDTNPSNESVNPVVPTGPDDAASIGKLMAAFADWKALTFQVPAGACPAISLDFSLFDHHFEFHDSTMCDLLDRYSGFIQTAAAFMFLLGAVLIIFGA